MRYRITPPNGASYLIPGDIHFPHEDVAGVAAMMDYWDSYQAKYKGVIVPGDAVDPYGVSRFPKRAKRMWDSGKVMAAVNAARPFLEWAGAQSLGCTYIKGNHEGWLDELFDQHIALEGLPGLEFRNLTGLADIPGLEILPEKTKIVMADKVVITHGHDLGAKTAKTIMSRYPDQFTILGHYHSIWQDSRTVYSPSGTPSVRGVACVGMMADWKALEYADDPDMQLGFGVLSFFGDRGNGQPFFSFKLHYVVKDEKGNAFVA